MDDAMMNALLKTYGAPNTVKNANAARAFFASNPEIAEKRAMGLRGSGLDDNSDVFGAQLDKLIADSDPQGTVTVGQPEKVIDTVKQATTPNAPRKKVQAGENKTYPNPKEAQGNPNDPGVGPPVAANAGGGSSWLDDLWPALLGLAYRGGGGGKGGLPQDTPGGGNGRKTGAMEDMIPEAKFAGRMPSMEDAANNDPRALAYRTKALASPQAKLADPRMDPRGAQGQAVLQDNVSDLSRVPVNEPAPTTVTGDPALTEQARRLQLQAEIEAENAAAQRLQDQIMERQMNQRRTQQLGTAAKQAVGRR